MFSTEAERLRQWETAEKNLQQIHDKDWCLTYCDSGRPESIILKMMFHEYVVATNWRGYLTIIKREKREQNWRSDLIITQRNTDIKKYRRDMENPITMAKDIARTVRKAEQQGRDSVDYIAMYNQNQQAQLIAAELYTHVTKEGLQVQKGYGGLQAVIFGTIHMNYNLSSAIPVLKINLTARLKHKGSTAGMPASAKILQDISDLLNKGYTIEDYSVDSSEYSHSGKIHYSTDQDIANFSRIYADIKTTSAGRAVIQKFMEDKMGKK